MNTNIYVACLASYNAGILHGVWLDMSDGYEAVTEGIENMLRESTIDGAEEWDIHNDEGCKIWQYGLEDACELLSGELCDFDIIENIVALVDYGSCSDFGSAIEYHENNYCGEYSSFEDFAESYIDDTGMLSEVPESLRGYFDIERFASDMEYDFNLVYVGNDLHIYHA